MSDDAFELSRRTVLAALGTTGVASVGAGFGTSAYFSDRETFDGNRLVAGELDLLVDWTEHYIDGRGDETGVEATRDDPDDDSYTPVPTADYPQLWVADKDAFMTETAVESFPDTDQKGTADDGVQDEIPSSSECRYMKQFLRQNGEWVSPLASPGRTTGDVHGQTTDVTVGDAEASDPLIDLTDVKPGDFGEVTFSLHLCDNPGYVWMNGSLDDELTSENGVNEAEADDPDEDQYADGSLKDSADSTKTVELLEALRAVMWYDFGTDEDGDGYPWEGPYSGDDAEGDNVQQSGEPNLIAQGSLKAVLRAFESGTHGIALDANPMASSSSTQVQPADGGNGDPGNTDFTATRYEKPQEGIVECADIHGEWLTVMKVEEENLPNGGDSETFNTSAGRIRIKGIGSDGTQPMQLAFDSSFPVTGVLVKGGQDSLSWTPDGQTFSSGTSGYHYDFADETTTDAWDSTDVALHAPTGKNGNRRAISNVQFCILPDDSGSGNGDPERDCFVASTTASIGFAWWLPVDHANEIQSDTVGFDLGFYTEQCRHNDGAGQQPEGGSSP
ncbi:SipW-dependent-type signal peptide-containing protein [Haloarchaeobius sp. HME9146]|uniref:SipW-dependent-type signal peptide-containing protein n=1 Tax=Haloarchaeobius sp. HME9146 TaxID=2978732 RepID=UPI0021C10FD9|nr:SipW-dependent-type signal peptide-containing protein [Haloarchaeobius sp. HME9146]MCT9097349.1 SipW-dependent-type signal peptide-containing protein [Haloarchaeobius sp. HME9146]